MQTVNKKDFRSSQTHEFEAMQLLVPAVIEKGVLLFPGSFLFVYFIVVAYMCMYVYIHTLYTYMYTYMYIIY